MSEANEAEPTFAPLCIWCSAPWSDDNVKLETVGAYSYDSDSSCGYPAVSIVCHACQREMYRKYGDDD